MTSTLTGAAPEHAAAPELTLGPGLLTAPPPAPVPPRPAPIPTPPAPTSPPPAGEGAAAATARAVAFRQLPAGRGAHYRSLTVVGLTFWSAVLLVCGAMFALSVDRWDGWRLTGPIMGIAATAVLAAVVTIVVLAKTLRAVHGDRVNIRALRNPARLALATLVLMALSVLATVGWITVEIRAGDVAGVLVNLLYTVMQAFVLGMAVTTHLMCRRMRTLPRRSGYERSGRVQQRLR